MHSIEEIKKAKAAPRPPAEWQHSWFWEDGFKRLFPELAKSEREDAGGASAENR